MHMESSAVPQQTSRFRLRDMAGRPAQRALLTLLGSPIEKLLSIDRINAIYGELQEQGGQDDFLARALVRLGVRYEVPPEQLKKLPANGPLVAVANHPLGLVEGMILAQLLRQVRPDAKVMANRLLALLPATQPYIIQVDPFRTRSATLGNRAPLKEALAWLEQGHALGIFPAGEVAHFKPGRRGVVDPPWSASVGRLILRSGANVVPVYFSGTNGALFHAAGLLHPGLRTLLLPKQMLRSGVRPIGVRIGAPVGAEEAARFAGAAALMRHLRRRTYWQGASLPRAEARAARGWSAAWRRAPAAVQEPVAPAVPAQALGAELSAVGAARSLLQSGDYQVLFAPAQELPCTLREIGRLREETFRAAGEGTGRALDLDAYDDYYWHLVIWNRADTEVVGAYRVCRMDEVVAQRGIEGLYSHTLFQLDARLLESLGPALELGRSFVRKEYQRAYAPLMLLWKGLGQILVREPRYKVFVGPVSISRQYPAVARQLILEFLQRRHGAAGLADWVRPRHPVHFVGRPEVDPAALAAEAADIDDVSRLVADLDPGLGGVPILLRQYVKLGGLMLGCSVDPAFSDVTDALLTVDLQRTERRVIEWFMGKREARQFLAYHGLDSGGRSPSPEAPDGALPVPAAGEPSVPVPVAQASASSSGERELGLESAKGPTGLSAISSGQAPSRDGRFLAQAPGGAAGSSRRALRSCGG